MQYAVRLALATAILLGMAATANAQSVMKQCGEQWQAAKAAGTTNGETWPQFLAQCRAQQKGGSAPAPTPSTFAPAPAPPAPTGQTSAGETKTSSQCNAEYAANKAAIKAAGQTKRDFVAACSLETNPFQLRPLRHRHRLPRPATTLPLPPITALHLRPLRSRRQPNHLTVHYRRLWAPASSHPINRHSPVVQPIPSFGSIRAPASITSRAPQLRPL